MIAKPLKQKSCKVCKSNFVPFSSTSRCCSPVCALSLVRADRIKAEKVAKVRERREDAIKRETQLKIPDLIKKAKHAFNAYIRERDAQKPCVCCGKPLAGGEVGGKFDCGHYRSVGSASHLRFNENNAHGQRKYCNRHGAGRAVDYRIGLIARIGLDRVEALESSNSVHKWQREELIAIKVLYLAKLKELKAREP